MPTDLEIYATQFWDRDALLQPESRAASLIPNKSGPWNSDKSRVAHVERNTAAPDGRVPARLTEQIGSSKVNRFSEI
jgi:hypothetical protein